MQSTTGPQESIHLDEYTLLEVVGRGGMSTVYRARQPKVDRDVAVKVISPKLSKRPGFIERFKREAKINGGLQHPHILPVYDAGEVDGQAYIVQPYMAGGSLDRRIGKHPQGLPVPEVVRVVTQIAGALDAIHDAGITHGDMKPGNILLDDRGHAYLGDFGIARTPGDKPSGVPGTYAYVAPELALAQRSPYPGGDVYSLAVVAFEMLAGETPFPIVDETSMVEAHQTEHIPDVSAWRPDLPNGINRVLREALHPDPERRPDSASEFAEALALAAEPHRADRWSFDFTPDVPHLPIPPTPPPFDPAQQVVAPEARPEHTAETAVAEPDDAQPSSQPQPHKPPRSHSLPTVRRADPLPTVVLLVVVVVLLALLAALVVSLSQPPDPSFLTGLPGAGQQHFHRILCFS